ncbi:bifunctional 4-hydroxy-2-oxoglutarate aldolase/2-dehydro-3-deoxy-phosphogluconate aldolase [Enterococcus gilvus]|uniref:bifunctional 4-hydroxy-2-oxoglutarate aldolase/2-dehydro-3-deoxy-phosphogluconate aldolase n=1 Tax=Enterococcus gilvus TaxID=160453 RepID=UPI001C8C8026|nr:bifunctional 4-hydroxy-2-oxoglutarate aldolase/2-dehydro-3-deoxy-phosphogluconate aldolase [Enterococcus gilvus]MBX8936922.1 bifunctional 4-hydroxy-2-oxoglutarate aldolase/2-dehydro-3-deoxy-phosphogluconate aldolase [Enterococcus gilvus]
MKTEEYPKITVILRGYSYEEAMMIIEMLSSFDKQVGVEVTTNNPDYLKIISEGTKKFGDQISIGVGTVLNYEEAKEAIEHGARFMLAPEKMDQETLALAKQHNVITVPAAFTPSEVSDLFMKGADIVKIFPATVVGPDFFKQLQGPYGKRRLMAVGGITIENAAEYLNNGAAYLGIGSSMFRKEDIKNRDVEALKDSVRNFLESIK